ncbi:cadmium resistance transporter [Actinoallomurus sp. NPDC050550]|uniref:cadmium resistance transporter n=1 Tax=Actinoallomurus sp. NPDC050550 TaxID=3154937 RepID=UPI00340B3876
MDGIAQTIAAAAGLFAGTNIDDIIVLAVLFLAGRASGTPRPWQIWAGQTAGFTVLVAVSVLAALGLSIVPGAWVGLLGLLPLALGVWGLTKAARAHQSGAQVSAAPAGGLVSVAILTIVNGADNLAVYPPVFRAIGTGPTAVTIVVFFAGVAAYCLIGSGLGSHKKAIEMIERWGHWIVPAVFVVIGVIILLGSGALTEIF